MFEKVRAETRQVPARVGPETESDQTTAELEAVLRSSELSLDSKWGWRFQGVKKLFRVLSCLRPSYTKSVAPHLDTSDYPFTTTSPYFSMHTLDSVRSVASMTGPQHPTNVSSSSGCFFRVVCLQILLGVCLCWWLCFAEVRVDVCPRQVPSRQGRRQEQGVSKSGQPSTEICLQA